VAETASGGERGETGCRACGAYPALARVRPPRADRSDALRGQPQNWRRRCGSSLAAPRADPAPHAHQLRTPLPQVAYYLRRTGINDLPPGLSLRIFFSGFVMAITPGKIGEVLKSLLLREVDGRASRVTAPIILAERLTDGIAMLFLASVGLVIFRYGVPVFATIAVIALCGFILLQQQRLIRWAIDAGARCAHFPASRTTAHLL